MFDDRPKRFPVPGVVWGFYPQRDENEQQNRPRQTGKLDVFAVAGAACTIETTNAANDKNAANKPGTRDSADTQAVITKIVSAGLQTNNCADALRLVGDLIKEKIGICPRPCQYQAAACLLNQQLVEMDTGEGKSLVIAMVSAVAAIAGAPVHVMTTNDYLASRDAKTFQPVFEALGLNVATVTSEAEEPEQRRRQYEADICYGTAKTMAFDYLRDQRLLSAAPRASLNCPTTMMRGLCFAIVDEADSILLDEAVMPLVLAEQVNDPQSRARLWQALDLARQLHQPVDFVVNKNRQIVLTPGGQATIIGLSSRYSEEWLNTRYRQELVTEALSAIHIYEKDRDYIVRDKNVLVVDRNTGRAVPGRQFPGQIHGLIAIQNGLKPPPPTQTASGLTFPRFFSRYHHLCGLSGTLIESRRELRKLYDLPVVRVDRNLPSQLKQLRLRIYECRTEQFNAAVARAVELSASGRPVLIGTDSVFESEELARCFAAAGQVTTVLNATNDSLEAQLISRAGISGTITIATQIAGRGTDIVPDAKSLAAGGLHVLNLQHNRNARIDRQMFGRAARQGDTGSCEQWIRLSDSAFSIDSLPGPLIRSFRLLAQLHLPETAQRVVRAYWHVEDRLNRSSRLRADRELSGRLHFSSMSSQ
ncbi:MAG: DEAD/DEAH box helicase [Burkholderiaceae bacterium]